jgi:ribosomal protein L11
MSIKDVCKLGMLITTKLSKEMHFPNTKDKDISFDVVVKSPFASYFLKKVAGLQSSHMNRGHKVAGTMKPKHIHEIAKIKRFLIANTCCWR